MSVSEKSVPSLHENMYVITTYILPSDSSGIHTNITSNNKQGDRKWLRCFQPKTPQQHPCDNTKDIQKEKEH